MHAILGLEQPTDKQLGSIHIVFHFQEPAPMTEDLLEEQSEVLAKLGTSAEGSHLRARMQSACLLSDMESFKVTQTSATHTVVQLRPQHRCMDVPPRVLLSLSLSLQAANPGCVLEDFVRWYSPRDYVEEEVVDEKGHAEVEGKLSTRMMIPGNMWVETWQTARVVPARRQKRLFDDTKEAEKVYLRSIISNITAHIQSDDVCLS